jgi:pyruvate dehydrogenase (quinone)
MGLQAIAVNDPAVLGAAWDTALSADRPTVLDVRCDPEVPPIPPHATYAQLKDMATSVLKGDPDAWHLMVQGAKTKAQEFVPHSGA